MPSVEDPPRIPNTGLVATVVAPPAPIAEPIKLVVRGLEGKGARARCDPQGENSRQRRRPQVAEDVEDRRG